MEEEIRVEGPMEMVARCRVSRALTELLGGVALLRVSEVADDLVATGVVDERTARLAVFEVSARLIVQDGSRPEGEEIRRQIEGQYRGRFEAGLPARGRRALPEETEAPTPDPSPARTQERGEEEKPVRSGGKVSELEALVAEARQAAGQELYHTMGFLMAICLQLMEPEAQVRMLFEMEGSME